MSRIVSVLVVALFGAGVVIAADRQVVAPGTIRGHVVMPESITPVARRPTIAELGMPAPRLGPDRRRSVVYHESAQRGAFAPQPTRRVVLDQRNETFMPRVLAITVGTIVEFPNNDTTYHNVFSLSRTKSFDLGRYATGRSKSLRFDRPGIIRVFCDIHSHMSAFILVFGHSYFSVTDDEGRFRIGDVAPGQYSVRVWHEVFAGEDVDVSVPEDGSDVEVNFALGPTVRRSGEP